MHDLHLPYELLKLDCNNILAVDTCSKYFNHNTCWNFMKITFIKIVFFLNLYFEKILKCDNLKIFRNIVYTYYLFNHIFISRQVLSIGFSLRTHYNSFIHPMTKIF